MFKWDPTFFNTTIDRARNSKFEYDISNDLDYDLDRELKVKREFHT